MKYLFGAILFLCFNVFAAQTGYSFVTNFTLQEATLNGSELTVTVSHPKTFAAPRFEIIPATACLESFPPQCRATIVRLDDQIQEGEIATTTLEADLAELFPNYPRAMVRLVAPNEEVILRY